MGDSSDDAEGAPIKEIDIGNVVYGVWVVRTQIAALHRTPPGGQEVEVHVAIEDAAGSAEIRALRGLLTRTDKHSKSPTGLLRVYHSDKKTIFFEWSIPRPQYQETPITVLKVVLIQDANLLLAIARELGVQAGAQIPPMDILSFHSTVAHLRAAQAKSPEALETARMHWSAAVLEALKVKVETSRIIGAPSVSAAAAPAPLSVAQQRLEGRRYEGLVDICVGSDDAVVEGREYLALLEQGQLSINALLRFRLQGESKSVATFDKKLEEADATARDAFNAAQLKQQ
jgi:hypothetical protein